MSNTTETLTVARAAISGAYVAHTYVTAETEVHGAFRLLTAEARRITLPTKGLGASRRASRIARARGLVKAAALLTQDHDTANLLMDANAALSDITVSVPADTEE